MAVINAWCGATTANSIRVVAKITGTSARLAIDTSAGMGSAVFHEAAAASAEGIVQLTATGLEPHTRYWWAVSEDGNNPDTAKGGQFLTHPELGKPASFKFTAAGDAGLDPLTPGVAGSFRTDRISNHTIFDTVRNKAVNEDHLFFAHLGDIHYYNPGHNETFITDDLTGYRRCVDDVLLQPRQHELYRNVPLFWIWDDHDYGRNDSDSTQPGRANAWQVYRERAPHYPLAENGAIYHSFQVGRVLFVALDVRSYKTPKEQPDDGAKTMLGPAQKSWLRSVLESSTADALVVLQQTIWNQAVSPGSDSWGGYNTERSELGNMFVDTGWADRMVMLGADAHTLALDTGANNDWGGFPTALLASLDARPSGTSAGFDLGISNDYNQYGVIDITDDSNTISITIQGYRNETALFAHTLSVVAPYDDGTGGGGDGPTPEPENPLPDIQAEPTPTITYLACDLKTGRLITYLRGVTGNISRSLGAYESTTLEIPTPLSGPLANRLVTTQVQAPNTLIVAVINNVPAWSGIVWQTVEDSEGGYTLSCITPESYLHRRYTGTLIFDQVEQTEIMAALAGIAANNGIPLVIDAEPTGILRDRKYFDDEDATLYKRIQELSNVIDGPEWTIKTVWGDEHKSSVRLVFYVRKVIGSGPDAPKGPITTMGRTRAHWKLINDWSKGAGANAVMATSSGQGEKRPQSELLTDIAPTHPIIEFRWSPSSSIKEKSTLNAHAASKLEELKRGTKSIEISARWDQEPARLGIDLDIGDWIEYQLFGPSRPAGVYGVDRMWGWKMKTAAGTFTPILAE